MEAKPSDRVSASTGSGSLDRLSLSIRTQARHSRRRTSQRTGPATSPSPVCNILIRRKPPNIIFPIRAYRSAREVSLGMCISVC